MTIDSTGTEAWGHGSGHDRHPHEAEPPQEQTSQEHHHQQQQQPPQPPIAIIGMSCRFGGDVTSPSRLWDLCAAGADAWSGIPQDRFDLGHHYDADREKPGSVRL